MNRAERRDRKERKWISRLKRAFYSGYRNFVMPIKTSGWRYHEAETFDELKEDKFGVMLKNTGTICSDKRLSIHEEHKRNLKNRSLSKEDQEELNEYLEDMNDKFAFEKYCGSCDHFQTEECRFKSVAMDNTQWKAIGCCNYMN